MSGETAPKQANRAADLSRLRIPRDAGTARRVRGFPWVRLVLLLALLGAAWVFRAPLLGLIQGATAPAVKTGLAVRVVPGQATESDVTANGYVVADRTTSVATVRSGRLVELNVEEGQIVAANAVVARIQYDDVEAEAKSADLRARAAQARVAEAEASLRSATLDLVRLDAERRSLESLASEARETEDRLARDVERNRALFETKRVDAATWDKLQADARSATKAREAADAKVAALQATRDAWEGEIARRRASLAVTAADELASRAAADVAAIEVEKTRIRAPFEGLVIRKDAEVGEVMAPTGAGGRGSVVTIVDPSSLEIQVELSERRIARVNEGDPTSVFLDADPDTRHPGKVRKVWPRADRSKGTIEVRVAMDSPPKVLRPEMAARVVFHSKQPAETGEPYVTVPSEAIREGAGGAVVFVVDGETVRQRPVKTGERRGVRTVILEGLDGGETVVLSPPASLKDGHPVRKEAS